jgi:hypothetical protein
MQQAGLKAESRKKNAKSRKQKTESRKQKAKSRSNNIQVNKKLQTIGVQLPSPPERGRG